MHWCMGCDGGLCLDVPSSSKYGSFKRIVSQTAVKDENIDSMPMATSNGLAEQQDLRQKAQLPR